MNSSDEGSNRWRFGGGAAAGPDFGDDEDDFAEATQLGLMPDREELSRRLASDLERVAAAGRARVPVDPSLAAEQLVEAVRATADRIGFATPVGAAVAVYGHAGDLPLQERATAGDEFVSYFASAGRTVAEGKLVRERVRHDAGFDLVFHRLGEEPNLTSLRLEAVVVVDRAGQAYLDAYGWPTVAVDESVVAYDGPAGGYVDQLLADLRAAVQPPTATSTAGQPLTAASSAGGAAAVRAGGRALFERGMLMALGSLAAQSRDGWLPQSRVAPAQDETLRLVAQAPALLSGYLDTAFQLAERGDPVSWTAGCLRRSAAEALFSGFLGSAAFEFVDSAALSALDDALRASAPDATLVTPPPYGVPAGHGWWRPGGR